MGRFQATRLEADILNKMVERAEERARREGVDKLVHFQEVDVLGLFIMVAI